MKKEGIILGFILVFSFMALNINSSSLPGYGGNESCNDCHNEPMYARNADVSFAIGNWSAYQIFYQNAIYSSNYVPVVQTNNRSAPIQYIRVQFLKNSTSLMMMVEVPDLTGTLSGTSSAVSDKFGIIFNIDVPNFTVGDFFNDYNASATNLNNVLTGQMAFSSGHADFWYLDLATTGTNSTGMAQDDYIAGGINTDGATHQDVQYAVWYGLLSPHAGYGYRYFFVRSLTDNDPNDVQFNNGLPINYAIAIWNDSSAEYHLSSFDQMVVVGNQISAVNTQTLTTTVGLVTSTVTQTSTTSTQNNVTVTQTVTQSAKSVTISTTSAFTAVFVLMGLIISIPILARYRKRD